MWSAPETIPEAKERFLDPLEALGLRVLDRHITQCKFLMDLFSSYRVLLDSKYWFSMMLFSDLKVSLLTSFCLVLVSITSSLHDDLKASESENIG